jgi:hypothetical protein
MAEILGRARQPELKAMVMVASQALALLDAPRLYELALSCEVLNRQLDETGQADEGWRRELAVQARCARSDMAVFERVLEATRANLNVMRRLRSMRAGELEYKAPGAQTVWAAKPAVSDDGNH